MSIQRDWQKKHQERGLCTICSRPLAPWSRARCVGCLRKDSYRRRMRTYVRNSTVNKHEGIDPMYTYMKECESRRDKEVDDDKC